MAASDVTSFAAAVLSVLSCCPGYRKLGLLIIPPEGLGEAARNHFFLSFSVHGRPLFLVIVAGRRIYMPITGCEGVETLWPNKILLGQFFFVFWLARDADDSDDVDDIGRYHSSP
jgi:hypothetical protein